MNTVEPNVISMRMGEIAAVVAQFYHVTEADLKGPKRSRSIAYPRQVLMYLARQFTRRTFEEIGTWIGFRDHTTVHHGVQSVAQCVERKDQLEHAQRAMEVEYLVKQLRTRQAAVA